MSGLTDAERAALGGVWPCCEHCSEDEVHDLPSNAHEIPCTNCICQRMSDDYIAARETAAVEAFRVKAVEAIEARAPRPPRMVDTKWHFEIATARRAATFDAAQIVRDLTT